MKSILLGLAMLAASTYGAPLMAQGPAPVAPRFAWQKMPIVSPAMRQAGLIGGEGTQWPRWDIAVSPADPNFLLLPIDVGGLYRSTDGGATWNISMQGWNARGANYFAIDPRNASRVIGIAGNSMRWDANWGQSPHGLYLSTDKAQSWRQVAARMDNVAGSAAFDPASFDKAKGFCTRAYYLSEDGELFRSEDGGQSWASASMKPIAATVHHDWTGGGAMVALVRVHPRSGAVYVMGQQGVLRSTDGGQTFTSLRDQSTFGLDIAADGTLFISTESGIMRSRDDGATWTKPANAGLDLAGRFAANVRVSPADARRLLCWVPGANWQWKRYVSHDGGESWSEAKLDATQAILPTNARQGYFAWHPKNADIAWSIGGDWVSKSTDGGRSFAWSNNGYNGVMVGTSFNFSAHQPNTVLLGFQDYNGAFTLDGGQTWNYRDISGLGWGGHCYGASQADSQVMWCGDAQSWSTPRRLKISRDGGQTWKLVPGADGKPLEWKGADVSFVSPRNAQVLFASNFRSTDKGATWAAMSSCDGVFIAAPDGTLVGKKALAIVISKDDGATWSRVAEVEGSFEDVAFDHKRGRYYVASQERLKYLQGGVWTTVETPRDQYNNIRVITVALDAQNPDIVLCGGPRNTYASAATVARSTDGARTWENLTTGDGPHETSWIRVHPITREAWLGGQCFGMWRLAPPKVLGAAPAPRPVAQDPVPLLVSGAQK